MLQGCSVHSKELRNTNKKLNTGEASYQKALPFSDMQMIEVNGIPPITPVLVLDVPQKAPPVSFPIDKRILMSLKQANGFQKYDARLIGKTDTCNCSRNKANFDISETYPARSWLKIRRRSSKGCLVDSQGYEENNSDKVTNEILLPHIHLGPFKPLTKRNASRKR